GVVTGVFAVKSLNGVADGVLYGNPYQLVIQATAVAGVLVYSGVMSFVLLKLIALVVPLRAAAEDETAGLDIALHGEEAYVAAGGVTGGAAAPPAPPPPRPLVLAPGGPPQRARGKTSRGKRSEGVGAARPPHPRD